MIVGAGAQRDVNNIIHRIRKLFEGDPLTLDDEGGNDRFISWYDLTLDAAMAIHAAQQLRQEAQTAQPPVATSLPNITPAALDEIHKKLAFLNVVPFVRNQVALHIDRATNEASIEFFEFFLSVADIQRQVAPTWNLFGDRSLFQDLSRTMDLRMLDVVARAPDFRGAPAVSLNLNLETVFTPGFGTFLERLEQGQKVIVEVQAVDVLTNFNMYLDAQAVLSSMGHAVLIDGLSTSALSMLDVALMKPDYAKIIWAPELLDMMDPANNQTAAFIVQNIGTEKVVLSRVDSANALAWGLKTGITVFQGHFLDAHRKRASAATAARRR
jgi:EAL domain-containing protein (putative c-di-GMP-specific phosphodiesterase class I)